MKKAFIAAAVIIVGLAIWYGFREPVPVTPPAQTAPGKPAKGFKTGAIPRAELETAKIAAEQPQTPEACTLLWEKTASSPLANVMEDIKRGVLRLDPKCAQFEIQNDIVKKLYAACAYDEQHGQLITVNECVANVPIYRAFCAERLSPDQRDYRSMSLALLANKIIARFLLDMQKPEAREELRKMVGAMIEREPGSLEARKALVAIEMSGSDDPGHSSEPMRAAIDAALRLNPNDPQLTEAFLFNEAMAGNAAAADAFVERNPDSGLGYYYRAWDSWKAGDHENALADLQQAARLLPADERINKTLHEVQAGQTEKPFTVTVGFSFDDL